jgi:hypothetical protein
LARPKKPRKGSRTISKREQREIDSGKRLQQRIVNTALRGITEIRVLIHRSDFSGLYKLGVLNTRLGRGKEIESSAYRRYSNKRSIQLSTGKVTRHFKPEDQGYGPSCMITTNDSTFDHLYNVYNRLPKLKITRLEYAIDLYCKTPAAASDLFYLLRRYLYVPRAVRTSMRGGKFYGWRDWLKDLRKQNAVYFIIMKKHSGKHIKVYERGNDRPFASSQTGWPHDKVNRVRIEFKLMRKAISEKYELDTLKDLLIDPKFTDIALEYIHFMNFQFLPKLPQDWEDYVSEDRKGNQESFVQEVLSAQKSVLKNITQYIEENQRMKALKDKIMEAAGKFDRNFQRQSRRRSLK